MFKFEGSKLCCNISLAEADLGLLRTSKMECFLIIVNGVQPLTVTTKHSNFDVAAALDPPLIGV